MYQKFQDIVAAAQQRSPKRVIAIAAAADEKMVHVAKAVTDMGLCDVILVGDEDALDVLLAEQGLRPEAITIVDEKDPDRLGLARRGARQLRQGGHPRQGQDEHQRFSARGAQQGSRPAHGAPAQRAHLLRCADGTEAVFHHRRRHDHRAHAGRPRSRSCTTPCRCCITWASPSRRSRSSRRTKSPAPRCRRPWMPRPCARWRGGRTAGGAFMRPHRVRRGHAPGGGGREGHQPAA